MEKIREEFENWARQNSLRSYLWWDKSRQEYEVFAVEMAFRGYQAGRMVANETPTN